MGGRCSGSTIRRRGAAGTSVNIKPVSISDMNKLMSPRTSGGSYSEDEARSIEKSISDMKVGTRLELSGERGYRAIFEKTDTNTWLRDGSTDDTRTNSGLASGLYGSKTYGPSYYSVKKSDTYSPKKAESVISKIGNDFTNNRSVVTKMGSSYQVDLFGQDVNNTRLKNKLRRAGFKESSKGIWRK